MQGQIWALLKGRIVYFIITFGFWLLFSWAVDLSHLVVGIVVSLTIVFWFGDIFLHQAYSIFPIKRIARFIYYLPRFVWEMIKANVDVAYRVIHPRMPIRPGIVKIKTDLRTDVGITALANSITLTPGTMTLDLEDGYLYIHWINVKATEVEEASSLISEKFERHLRHIFG